MDFTEYLLKNPEGKIPLIDVRSPGEYTKGHIPGSINIPLFSNEERAVIGTLYKKEGRLPAILTGLEIIGPGLKSMALKALKECPQKKAFVHCWRGGMRSASFAELLKTLGFEVQTLKGGYKHFRKWVMAQLSQTYSFKVLGGFTGSGKTDILHLMEKLGVQIIDLEKRASHLGSAFGTLGVNIQPSQEQFENDLAFDFFKLNPEKTIWLEDESRTLGKLGIPPLIWEQMRNTRLYKLDLPLNRRRDNIIRDYETISSEFVETCIHKIEKRLGGLETKNALDALKKGDKEKIIEIMLNYYDRTYLKGQKLRPPEMVDILSFEYETNEEIAKQLAQIF